MGNLESGGRNADSKERAPKADPRIALFLAGALAGAVGNDAGNIRSVDTAMQNSTTTSDYGSSDEYRYSSEAGVSSGSYSFELPASPEAVQAVLGLDRTLGKELQATPEQRAQVVAMIDAYISAHPPIMGKTEEVKEADGSATVSGGGSYNPYYELWNASTNLGISPALQGVLLAELSERMGGTAE